CEIHLARRHCRVSLLSLASCLSTNARYISRDAIVGTRAPLPSRLSPLASCPLASCLSPLASPLLPCASCLAPRAFPITTAVSALEQLRRRLMAAV
ncbi:MAG: hypothetical protein C0183_19915, partial [Roseiflexus castenholzii]